MTKFLVSPQFVKNFEKVVKHYGCTEEEIAAKKQEIKSGDMPMEEYEKSFEVMASHIWDW
jgi:hypothetical protein